MFTNFSAQARAAVEAAQSAVRTLLAPHLGVEHLVIGLAKAVPDLPVPQGQSAVALLGERLAAVSDHSGGGDGTVQATPAARTAIKRADELRLARGDAEVVPLHLMVASLEGLLADEKLTAAVAEREVDVAAWLEATRTSLAALPPVVAPPARGAGGPQGSATALPATPNLDRYGRDLTALARQGGLPPLIGRDREVRSMIEVLCKMTKNNPALVGEPGVGKTALVEGLAQRIAEDKVPFHLRDRRLVALDLNSMLAGTRYRGDFEERLRAVLDETQKSRTLLFLDEMHTMIGAGDSEGGGDLANILKPYLTRGDISVIGATTAYEYRRYIERDGALERRFQPLLVEEPSAEATLNILQRLRPRFEDHYRAVIPDAVLEKVVDLSREHLRHRYFPDKAIDVLQLACTRGLLEKLDAEIEQQQPVEAATADAEAAASAGEGANSSAVLSLVADARADQGGAGYTVSTGHVLSVLAELTGVPLEHFAGGSSLAERYKTMEEELGEAVFGQPEAITAVANAIRVAKRQMSINPLRPDGVFLFLGPPGVGKSELGRALGRFLFGDGRHILHFDMTEFSESHTMSRLIGAPPGYIGYDEGGQLTEKVRSHPFSLLVLDELEKAHPSVINLFLQVFDEGRLTDGHGRTVYFSNVTVILTSNAGADRFAGRAIGFNAGRPEVAGYEEPAPRLPPPDLALIEARKHFPAELLSRVDKVVLFRPLSRATARRIVVQKLDSTLARIFGSHNSERPAITVTYTPEVVDHVVARGFNTEWGARYVERTLEEQVLAPLARQSFDPAWDDVCAVKIGVADDNLAFEFTHSSDKEESANASNP